MKENYDEENNFDNLLRKKISKNGFNGSKRAGYAQKVNEEGPVEKGTKKSENGGKSFMSPCRSRLYQYKTEYRKFLKRHFFHE